MRTISAAWADRRSDMDPVTKARLAEIGVESSPQHARVLAKRNLATSPHLARQARQASSTNDLADAPITAAAKQQHQNDDDEDQVV